MNQSIRPSRPDLPLDVISHLCSTVSILGDRDTLARLARASFDLHDVVLPELYRKISLDEGNIVRFFRSSCTTASVPADKEHPGLCATRRRHGQQLVTELHIESLSDVWPECVPSDIAKQPTAALINLHTLVLGSKAIWQLVVHYHTHSSHHPIVALLSSAAPSLKRLVIHYPTTERTAHSSGGGFCCCLAAVRAFQRNPLRAAAYDTASVTMLLSALTGKWELEELDVRGVVDEPLPLINVRRKMRVEWASCQCADKGFHGEWCFNHVYPCRRVEQIRELQRHAQASEVELELSGAGNVGWTEKKDMGRWILDKAAEERPEHEGGHCIGTAA